MRVQYLGLRQAQFGRQVGPLRQGQVLGLLEALVEGLELQAGVNGPRLPDLLPLPIEPHLSILDHRRGLVKVCGGGGGREHTVLRSLAAAELRLRAENYRTVNHLVTLLKAESGCRKQIQHLLKVTWPL